MQTEETTNSMPYKHITDTEYVKIVGVRIPFGEVLAVSFKFAIASILITLLLGVVAVPVMFVLGIFASLMGSV